MIPLAMLGHVVLILTMFPESSLFFCCCSSDEFQNGALDDNPKWPGRWEGNTFISIWLARDVSPTKVFSLLKNGSETGLVTSFAFKLSGFLAIVERFCRFFCFEVVCLLSVASSSLPCCRGGGSLLKSTIPEEKDYCLHDKMTIFKTNLVFQDICSIF